MESSDNVVFIRHEADWSSTATIWWTGDPTPQRQVAVEARLLWSGESDLATLVEPLNIPPHVLIRAVRLAARGRALWESDRVLSRPVPRRAMSPARFSVESADADPTDAWLFDHELATERPPWAQTRSRPIPLGWVENVAIAMFANGGPRHRSTAVLIDIGAPHRGPCTCGKAATSELHEHGCPQSNLFPRIGRLALNMTRIDAFIQTLQTARISFDRVFVPEPWSTQASCAAAGTPPPPTHR
jgi:hypothetical protein